MRKSIVKYLLLFTLFALFFSSVFSTTYTKSVATGTLGLDQTVRTYLDGMAAKAQQDATTNARQSGKYTRVVRQMQGETCKWCENLAGTYTNPDSEVFKRHRDCDCTIVTEGYKSRNGLLSNYVKPTNR